MLKCRTFAIYGRDLRLEIVLGNRHVRRGESALLTVPEQLLPQFLGTRLDKVRGRRYDERPLAGQSHDGGAREVLLTATSPSPRGGGGGGGIMR